MKISYNWLKEYIDIDMDTNKVSEVLTDIGLEVEGLETYESIKGGLEGFVIGEVITCEKHPNAKKLSLTTVNVGGADLLNIVCGAPNVAAGQKVVVATVGTTIYSDDESFKIKKSKIRGEESFGMICAEDELGLGKGHDGILVLDADAKVGMLAKDFFNISSDTIFEIGLTPNRVDGSSHYGVARDLAAYISQNQKVNLRKPIVANFKIDTAENPIQVEVENKEACHRYSGLTIYGIKVSESPEWLKNRLQSIGLSPINNIVDITNFVLHELGQPLHAFDADKIKGNKVVVKTLPKDTPFTTLDEVERKLSGNDLMICNESEAMCIAGVFGGIGSGVVNDTTNIFLESAYFNPVSVRKTAKFHGLNTDASFRFERGTDPNITVYALKRAALLIQELAGGTINSDIFDYYPEPVQDFKIKVSYANVDRLIGNKIEKETIKHILEALEIKIVNETEEGITVLVPPYRVDVQREADIIEEILRIYGYNYVTMSKHVNSTITHYKSPDEHKMKNMVADMFAANGFNEMMCNSLTKAAYYTDLETMPAETLVKIFNPLSQDLNVMRQTLLFGGLETIAYNANRRNADLKLFEFGNCYFYHKDKDVTEPVRKYEHEQRTAIFITGNKNPNNWITQEQPSSFYEIKTYVDMLFSRLGYSAARFEVSEISNEIFAVGLEYKLNKKTLVSFGIVSNGLTSKFDIENEVYYAEINWDIVFKYLRNHKVSFTELSKFPEVKRDLSMIVDKQLKFEQLQKVAFKTEKKLLRHINIFDVFEGKNIPEGKKSYAVSFYLQDATKTLNDKYIDKVMNGLIKAFERELDAEIRSS